MFLLSVGAKEFERSTVTLFPAERFHPCVGWIENTNTIPLKVLYSGDLAMNFFKFSGGDYSLEARDK